MNKEDETAKGEFSLVTGIGHCGTKWLSTVLNHPDQGTICYHELSHTTSVREWERRQAFLHRQGVGRSSIPRYWSRIEKDLLQYTHVCDSMSWCPVEAGKIAQAMDATRVIYLVRNGIQQLHSVAQKSIWKQVGDDHFLYGPFLKRYWELAGKPHQPWSRWSRWEKLCLWWGINDFMPKWIGDHFDGDVDVYRLEDLTTDVPLLSGLLKSYGLEATDQQIKAYQKHDVNRKVQGDRRPETLWKAWTGGEREAFKRICGEGMARYHYREVWR